MEKLPTAGLSDFFPDPSRVKEFAPKEPLGNVNITKGRVLFDRMKPLTDPNAIRPLFK